MYYFYETSGTDPVCWVEMRAEAQAQLKSNRSSIDILSDPKWPLLSMRWFALLVKLKHYIKHV